jgi:hypothetical protein
MKLHLQTEIISSSPTPKQLLLFRRSLSIPDSHWVWCSELSSGLYSIIRDIHPWWWRQHVPLKRRSTIILHGSTTQKTALLSFHFPSAITWPRQTPPPFSSYAKDTAINCPAATSCSPNQHHIMLSFVQPLWVRPTLTVKSYVGKLSARSYTDTRS